MKKILSILTFAGLAIGLSAQNVDQVYITNGSVYEGYISEQVPGEYISVQAVKSTIVVESAQVSKIKYTPTEVGLLSEAMRKWVDENKPSNTVVDVASLDVSGHRYSEAIMLESGSGIKFITFESAEYKVAWKDIVKTTKNEAGIIDVVTLHNGKYIKGRIVEQVLGSEMKIKTEDEAIHVVKNNEILCINSEQLDKNRSLWSQLHFLDLVELKNGECYEGFIASRLFGKYVAIATRDSGVEKYVQLSDIAKYVKKLNPDYEEVCEKPVEEETKEETKEEAKPEPKTMDEIIGDITINDNPVKPSESEHIGQLYVLPKGTENIFYGNQVRVRIPIEETSTSLRIVRLKKRRIMVTTHRTYDGINRFWSFIEEYNMLPTRNYYISAINKEYVEVTVYGLKPGYYMILPFVGSDKCAAFEIKK